MKIRFFMQPKHFVCKRYLLKIFILTTLLLSAISMSLYISNRPDRIRQNPQNADENTIKAKEATAFDVKEATVVDVRESPVIEVREVTLKSNKENSFGKKEEILKKSAMNVNVNIKVNMSEVSKAVIEILNQLEQSRAQRKAGSNDSEYRKNAPVNCNNEKDDDSLQKELMKPIPKYLLSLFSTWKNAKETAKLHTNTLRNWASFKPAVNVILFTDDVYAATECINLGWTVLKIPKKARNGLPVLKYMYMEAMEVSDSYFYGYANSDILFTDGLLNTLLTLTYSMRDMFISRPILVTGNRWNVANVTENEIVPRKNIENTIKQRGNFFMTSAEEYFITSYDYPWADIPDLVIGIVAYDNWLVLNARMSGHITIDTSKTIIAMHQDLDKIYYRSHFRNESAYNENLLKLLYQSEIPYEKGYANCIDMYTELINDTIVITKRKIEDYCMV